MTLKDPIKQPQRVYNNGRVAIGRDLVFGWVVLAVQEGEDQSVWLPIDQLHTHERRRIYDQMNNEAVFPEELHQFMFRQRWGHNWSQYPGQLREARPGLPDDFHRVMRGEGQETMQEKMERMAKRVDGPMVGTSGTDGRLTPEFVAAGGFEVQASKAPKLPQGESVLSVKSSDGTYVHQAGHDPNATIVEESSFSELDASQRQMRAWLEAEPTYGPRELAQREISALIPDDPADPALTPPEGFKS